MSLSALLGLLRLQLRRGRRSFMLSAAGVAIGIASLCFFLALSHGVQGVVLGKVFPVGQLEVVPRKASVGPLGQLGFGGPTPLDDRFVDALRQRTEVKTVFRRMKLAFPARAWGGQQLIGREVHAELIAEGLDPSATAGEDFAPIPFSGPGGSQKPCNADTECSAPEYCPWDTHLCEPPVPVVISPFLVEIYNSTIAKSHNLPQLGPALLARFRGLQFTAELGRSFLASGPGAGGGLLGAAMGGAGPMKAEPHQRRMMLVGTSRASSPLALSIPIDYVRKWNQQYVGSATELSSVTAVLKDGARTAGVAAFVREHGYDLADSGAEQAGLAITLMTALFALVSLAILLVATMNIAHSFLRAVAERRRELGLLRALGATQRDLASMLLAEAAVLGLCGGLAGLVGARLSALVVDVCARRFVPDFPFKPESFFAFDWSVVALGLGASIVACLVGALLPARMAARVDPAAALSGS